MTSAGAITTLQDGIDEPERLVESGPAGGAVLASQVAEQIGARRALSFDMGGTTAKICFIDDFRPEISRSFEFGRVHRHLKGSGLPIRIPVVEMVEIGAGGGSIARVNHLGVIQVGPDSAGSSPGPASYGLGGRAPTVTDAHVTLGTIDPQRFAVGKVRLDPALGRAALAEGLAEGLVEGLVVGPANGPIDRPADGPADGPAEGPAEGPAGEPSGSSGFDVGEAAQAVIEVVTESMANAARVHASELGKATEDCTLIAFGGAAPLHAALLARKLGIRRFVIPASAGVGSALGFLWAPVAYQAVRSLHQHLDRIDHGAVQALLTGLTAHADAVVGRAAPGAPLSRQQTVFMRYAGQGHEIAVDLPAGSFNAAAVQALHRRFEARYAELYGRALPHIAVEAVSWSVAVTAGSRTTLRPDVIDAKGRAATPVRERAVYDPEQGRWLPLAVFERASLRRGDGLIGPALVVEDETTTWLPAGFELRVSAEAALVLTDRSGEIGSDSPADRGVSRDPVVGAGQAHALPFDTPPLDTLPLAELPFDELPLHALPLEGTR